MNFWAYLLGRFMEPSTHAGIATAAAGVAAAIQNPTVQTIAGTIAALSSVAAMLIPENNSNAVAAVKAVSSVADAVANNANGNSINMETAAAQAASGVVQAAAADPKVQNALQNGGIPTAAVQALTGLASIAGGTK